MPNTLDRYNWWLEQAIKWLERLDVEQHELAWRLQHKHTERSIEISADLVQIASLGYKRCIRNAERAL